MRVEVKCLEGGESKIHPTLNVELGNEFSFATANIGGNKRTVCVLVEFCDGRCICEVGEEGLAIFHKSDLKFWIEVKSVKIDDTGRIECFEKI